jgi:hypothetical protein
MLRKASLSERARQTQSNRRELNIKSRIAGAQDKHLNGRRGQGQGGRKGRRRGNGGRGGSRQWEVFWRGFNGECNEGVLMGR